MEFQELTCKEIGEFCMSKREKEEQDYKISASIQFRNVSRLLNAFSTKPKNITFEKLFPEFDERRKQNEMFNNLNEETKEQIIADKWRTFLGK